MRQYLFILAVAVFFFTHALMGGSITAVNVKDFGATGDGTTNDEPFIMAAYNYGLSAGINRLYFPVPLVAYRIATPLNFTNRGERPLIIEGDGMSLNGPGCTAILGQTGGWMAAFTGSEFVEIRNIKFYSTGANASTFGLLFSRGTTNPFAMYMHMYRVLVDIATSPNSSAVGSIAVANNAAENCIVEHCWFTADTPYVGMMDNEVGLPQPFIPFGTVLSAGLMNFRNTCFIAKLHCATMLYGVINTFFDKCYWDLASGNTTTFAIMLRASNQGNSSCRGIKFTGQVEQFPSVAYLESDTYDIDFDMIAVNSTQGYIMGFAGTNHHNLRVNVHQINGTMQQILAPTGATMNLYGGELTVYPGMSISNANIKLLGTIIKAGQYDGSLIVVAAGSSYTYHTSVSTLRQVFTWNPGTVSNGGMVASSAITVTNAAIGDTVQVFPPYTMQNCTASGYVSAADTVQVVISNTTGSGKTFANSANWKVRVSKY
jgi:hypothetical protein